MRFQMVWFAEKKLNSLDLSNITTGNVTISNGRHFTMVYYESECNELDDVRKAFIQLSSKGLFCRSIKLFERGKLPSLRKYGYSFNGTYYHKIENGIPITAVPYGEEEWCMLIEYRKGSGIQLHMLRNIPYFQETFRQLSLDELSFTSA